MTAQPTTTVRQFTEEADFLENAQVGDVLTRNGNRTLKTSTVLTVLTPKDPGYREEHRTLICETITTSHHGRPHYAYRSLVTRNDRVSLGPVTEHGGRFITHDLSGALSSSVRLGDVDAARFSAKGLAAAHAEAVDLQRQRVALGLAD